MTSTFTRVALLVALALGPNALAAAQDSATRTVPAAVVTLNTASPADLAELPGTGPRETGAPTESCSFISRSSRRR